MPRKNGFLGLKIGLFSKVRGYSWPVTASDNFQRPLLADCCQ